MRIGYLYGGQGSQVEGMGKDLYENIPHIKNFYDSIDMGFDLKELSFNGKIEDISKTKYTQGILLAHQIAVTKILEKNKISPTLTLGLSLGEYGALYGAGVIDHRSAMDIIKLRSSEMAKVEDVIEAAMAAVMSEEIDLIEQILNEVSSEGSVAEISGINTKNQVIISGEKRAINSAIVRLKKEGLRVISLNTSGPFHTCYMNSTKEKLQDYLKSVEFKSTNVSVYSNYTGKIESENWGDLLAFQVSNPVRLKDALEDFLSKDLDLIIEIGFQNTMRGFIKKLDRNVEVIPLNSLGAIEKFLTKMEGDQH